MKKLSKIILLLILFTTLTTTGCGKKETKAKFEEPTATPLFYKITKDGSDSTVYLLGSMHAAKQDLYPLNNTVMNAFYESDYLAVELDILAFNTNFQEQLKLSQKMVYTDGSNIKKELGKDLYYPLVSLLREKDSYDPLYDNYKPVFFESLLQNLMAVDAGLDTDKGIDMHFLTLAKQYKKTILEVESAEFQYDLLLGFPTELSKITISNTVNNYDEGVKELKNLYNIWKKGDLTEIEEVLFSESEGELSEEEQALLEMYNKSMITDRNVGMADALEQYMNEGKNVFYTVGLAHIVGEEGIVKLLENKGYTIEKLN